MKPPSTVISELAELSLLLLAPDGLAIDGFPSPVLRDLERTGLEGEECNLGEGETEVLSGLR